MNPVYLWILRDILGIRHEPRTKAEKRKNLWRAVGWGLALTPWLVLAWFWW